MNKAYWKTEFKETIRLCEEAVRTLQGSETLKYIRRIEKCLKRLVDELN